MVEDVVVLFKASDHIFFFVERLYDVMSAVDLLYLTVDMSQILLLIPEISLGMLYDHGDHPHCHRKDQQRDQCHQWTDTQHHDQNTDDSRHRCDQLSRALVQTLA